MTTLVILENPVEETAVTGSKTIKDILVNSGVVNEQERPSLKVICPICGSTYTNVDDLNYDYVNERDYLHFHCEQGHAFDIEFKFCKGETFVQIKRVYEDGKDLDRYNRMMKDIYEEENESL
jgi:hypothetical protein